MVAALALCACALSPEAPVATGAEPAAMTVDASPARAASTGPGREFHGGLARDWSDGASENVNDQKCRGVAAGVGGRWTGRWRESRGEVHCRVAGATRTRLRAALDLTVERGTNESCSAAAVALRASWSGLWWYGEHGVVCALTPRGRADASMTWSASERWAHCEETEEDADQGGYCWEYPVPVQATVAGITLHDRPVSSARVVGEVAPGEVMSAIGQMNTLHFAHRGIVRRAGGRLRVGDTVYPATRDELDAYPFRDRDDPADDSFAVVMSGEREDVRFNSANAPLIDWEELRPSEQSETWIELVRTDGSQGWALVRPCDLVPDHWNDCSVGGVRPSLAPGSNTAHPPLLFTLRANGITHAKFSADGTRIVTQSLDGVERVWDAETGAFVSVAPRVELPSVSVEDGAAMVRTADGRQLFSLRDDESRVNAASLVADGARIATLSANLTVNLWDVATGRRLFRFEGRFGRLGGFFFSPDGVYIATWADYLRGDFERDSEPRLWDAADGRLIRTLPGDPWVISPDWRQVMVGDTIFDTRTGQVTGTIRLEETRHVPYNSFAFSPDGTRVLTGDPLDTASVWNIATGRVVLRLDPYNTEIPGVTDHGIPNWSTSGLDASYSPDGARILTVGRGDVRVWDMRNAVYARR